MIVLGCSDLTDPPHGNVSPKNGNYNDKVTYTCNIGYKIEGPKMVTCDSTGNWSSTTTCKGIQFILQF